MCCRLCLSGIFVALACCWSWLNQVDLDKYVVDGVRPDPAAGFDPAPSWFLPALKQIPPRFVTDEEREELRREGAIVLRGVVKNQAILRLLEQKLGWVKLVPKNHWTVNDLLHTFIRHGPLAGLSASALNVSEVTIWNAQLEPRPPKSWRTEPYKEKPWYDMAYGDVRDQSVHEDTDHWVGSLHKAGHFAKPQMSIFLALTPIPHGIEFLGGSHIHNQKHRCRRAQGYLDPECMNRLEQDCSGFKWWDLAPGDLVLFYGSTFHWTVLAEYARLALSVRYIPADMTFTGMLMDERFGSYHPWKCGPLAPSDIFPVMYSSRTAELRNHTWPVWPRRSDTMGFTSRLRQSLWDADPRCGPIFDY